MMSTSDLPLLSIEMSSLCIKNRRYLWQQRQILRKVDEQCLHQIGGFHERAQCQGQDG